MIRLLVLFVMSSILVACQSVPNNEVERVEDQSHTQQTQNEQQQTDKVVDGNTIQKATSKSIQPPVLEDPIITNLLAQGNNALKRNNLLTPEDDNANMYFQAILGREPENVKARQGLHDIVTLYTRWAIQKTKQGQHKTATKYMNAATFVNPEDEQITKAKKTITDLRKKKKAIPKKIGLYGNRYYLPSNLLKLKDEVVLQHLQPIIDRLEKDQESLHIYWPNDRGARLLYKIINSRTDEFRVRGMIYLRKANYIEIKKN